MLEELSPPGRSHSVAGFPARQFSTTVALAPEGGGHDPAPATRSLRNVDGPASVSTLVVTINTASRTVEFSVRAMISSPHRHNKRGQIDQRFTRCAPHHTSKAKMREIKCLRTFASKCCRFIAHKAPCAATKVLAGKLCL